MKPDESGLTFELIAEGDIPELTRVMARVFDDDAWKHLGLDRGGSSGYDNGDFIREWLFGYDRDRWLQGAACGSGCQRSDCLDSARWPRRSAAFSNMATGS